MFLFSAGFRKFHCWSTARRRAVSALGTLRGLTRTTLLQLLSTAAIFIDTHGDVTQHAIVDAHAAFELGDLAARPFDLEQHKRTVLVVQDLVGELALAHHFVPD